VASNQHLFKFGIPEGPDREILYAHADVWAMQETSGPRRLAVGPAAHHVRLLQYLLGVMSEPFGLLYVLVVPRSDEPAGRYQSPYPLSKPDLLAFLNRFEQFLESDARHNLWVASIGEPNLLVYDKHELIYAYGQLDGFKKILNTQAIVEVPEITIPSPHIHYYHQEYDEEERRLLGYWNWMRSPLREQDDE
jgi:hypothetical protein